MLTKVNWANINHRKHVIMEILGYENTERKAQSVKEVDTYRGFVKKYVEEELYCQYSNANEIPVISSINIAKRVVDDDSRLYMEPVKRTFMGVTDAQQEVLEEIYKDLKLDTNLLRSQRYLGLQQQNIVHILPKNKKLIVRPYKMHQIDAIPKEDNPEMAQSFIVSAFDKRLFDQIYAGSSDQKGDNHNETIADYDDAVLRSMKFAVWDEEFQFIMNGKGEVLSNETGNMIDELPFVDIFHEKDFTFFVECGNDMVEFTIQYNTALSTEAQIIKLQGFAQPFLKGPAAIFSHELKIGPDRLIELPTDLEGIGEQGVDFGYANPNSDLSGIKEHRVQLMNDFLNSRGVSRAQFEGAVTHSSGVERLLAMVKDFERTKEDQALYEMVERKIFKLIVKWHNAALGTDLLDEKYLAGGKISEDAEIVVEYQKPQMIMTEEEKVKVFAEKEALGLDSKVKFIMREMNMDEDDAREFLESLEEETDGGEDTQPPRKS